MLDSLQVVTALFILAFLLAQVFDVLSTNWALTIPGVIEIGDTRIGLGNLAGWAQKHWGRFWWLIKLPTLGVVALLWIRPAEAFWYAVMILALIIANLYFWSLVQHNYSHVP